MDSGRLFFDQSCHNNMLFLGNADSIFREPRLMVNMEETSRRRPFFSSPDELFDEEYNDEQLPEKKRRLTPEQVHLLEKSFGEENKLEPERKNQLANKLGLQPRQVAVWFQNRRARWKTKQLERDYDQLKSSYDSLLSDYDSIHKENEKLKAEVMSLIEKMDAKEVVAPASTDEKHEPLVGWVNASAPGFDQQLNIVKVEDRLSTGSEGSAVVDDDGPHLLVDSGDSYFPDTHDYPPDPPAQSEEDDRSDDGRSYFSNGLVTGDHHHQTDEAEPMGWWVWS